MALLVLVAASCQKNFTDEAEMQAFIADQSNNYSSSKTVNGIDFTIQYRPTDLMVKQEAGDSPSVDLVNKLREKYKQYLYFSVMMRGSQGELLNYVAGDKTKFGKMVNTFAFDFNNKAHFIISQRDTIPMADFVYPRMYGMGSETTILIAYPRNKVVHSNSDHAHFIIEDLGLETGDISFKIDLDVLQNEPKLQF